MGLQPAWPKPTARQPVHVNRYYRLPRPRSAERSLSSRVTTRTVKPRAATAAAARISADSTGVLNSNNSAGLATVKNSNAATTAPAITENEISTVIASRCC